MILSFNVWFKRYSLLVWVIFICSLTLYVKSKLNANDKSSVEGFFWVFSDAHVDIHYRNDGDPVTHCRNVSLTNKTRIIRKFGHFDCDAPRELLTSAFTAAINIDSKVDFVIWLGDSTSHRSAGGDTLIPVFENLSQQLRNFFPKTLILPVLGNHDIVLTANRSTRFRDFYNQTQMNLLLTDTDARRTFLKGGYYSIRFQTLRNNKQVMLRFVVLNTGMFQPYILDFFNTKDAIEQIEWFNRTMSEAFELHDRVLLLSHLPFGINEDLLYKFYNLRYEEQLLTIINRYSSIIIMCLSGHRHFDILRVYSSGNITMGILNHAAISPVGYLTQPSIRKYSYDKQRLVLTDYEQYSLNVLEAERTQNDHWSLTYRFSSWYYQRKEITSESLFHLVQLIRRESFYLKRFLLNKHHSGKRLIKNHDIIHSLCALTLFNFDEFILCSRILKNRNYSYDNLIGNHSLDINVHENEQWREYRMVYLRVLLGVFIFLLSILIICYRISVKCASQGKE
ncbi:unnamed protein product [Adineta ricciae]|uniref:Uncharacterized protein n=1 Tax=Adineta ricciae TaxID=249248 RepID=A0A815BKF3_ADIRI|nr:unnamed protein product [Adineta ricciae]